MTADVTVIAIDWSGRARHAASAIWTAAITDGEITLVGGREREAAIAGAIELARASKTATVGLDFSFSFPEWFVHRLGCTTASAVWERVALDGEAWLADPTAPFWGRRGSRRPVGIELLRRTEAPTRFASGRPFSTFQIGGAGAVGTGSIRGMPYLRSLRDAGLAIWPFDPRSPRRVVEIYPRMFTGPVVKRDPRARRDLLETLDHSALSIPTTVIDAASASEDAFDALWAAIGMWRAQPALDALDRSDDPTVVLEGWIFGARA